MNTRSFRAFTLVLLALIFGFGGSTSAAVPTVISKVPYTISKPGRYALSKSLVYPGTGFAIIINADNVLLDLNDWTLESLSPGDGPQVSLANETAGIYALNRKNVTIRNGTIRGFFRGIYLEGASGRDHLVENIHVNACTFLGIQVKGLGSVIRHNRVSKVGGATSYTVERIGIDIIGDNIVVKDNVVSEVRPNTLNGTDRAYGIRVLNSKTASVTGNHIFNPEGTQANGGNSVAGVKVDNCSWVQSNQNQIGGFLVGIDISGGVGNLYRDNSVVRSGIPYQVVGTGSTATAVNNYP